MMMIMASLNPGLLKGLWKKSAAAGSVQRPLRGGYVPSVRKFIRAAVSRNFREIQQVPMAIMLRIW
jgi:hypothetical protein